MERVTALDVFYGKELIGTVFDTEPLSFEYAPTWLGRQQPAAPFPLSSIALQPGRLVEPQVQAFFENLLPEGEVRAYLSAQRKASTLFALLQEVAGDTAGAYVMLPQGQRPQRPAGQGARQRGQRGHHHAHGQALWAQNGQSLL
jgi:serine/threonine-protein kinase HipA